MKINLQALFLHTQKACGLSPFRQRSARTFFSFRGSSFDSELYVDQYPNEFSWLEHTPIFAPLVTDLLLGQGKYRSAATVAVDHEGKECRNILDMTFGTGSRTENLLRGCEASAANKSVSVIACASGMKDMKAAKMAAAECPLPNKITPIRCRFSQLISHLLDVGCKPGSLDGIVIDTGCYSYRWVEKENVFGPAGVTSLDLRHDADVNPGTPSGTDILLHIDAKDLLKMLKSYSVLKQHAKQVASSIIEARFLFNKFQKIHDLHVALESAATQIALHAQSQCRNGITKPKEAVNAFGKRGGRKRDFLRSPDINNFEDLNAYEKEVTRFLMRNTLTALRMFVNDEVNELDFAVRVVAKTFLKPDSGVLIVVAHNEPEQKAVSNILGQVEWPSNSEDCLLTAEEVKVAADRPWSSVVADSPLPLTLAEQTLNPGFSGALLFAAKLS